MKKLIFVFFIKMTCAQLIAQDDWEFQNQNEFGSLYTKSLDKGNLKMFKVEFEVNTRLTTFYNVFSDPWNIYKWGQFIDFEILGKKDGLIHYRTVFDSPWPFTDRQSIMQIAIQKRNSTEGLITIQSSNNFPQKMNPELVTIHKSKFTWELIEDDGITKVKYSGFADPSGNIPVWLINQLTEVRPLEYIELVKTDLELNY
jgi:hypothetical protein